MISDRAKMIERILTDVAELPDRTSPENWPDAMLVTADELRMILDQHLHPVDRLHAETKNALEVQKTITGAQALLIEDLRREDSDAENSRSLVLLTPKTAKAVIALRRFLGEVDREDTDRETAEEQYEPLAEYPTEDVRTVVDALTSTGGPDGR